MDPFATVEDYLIAFPDPSDTASLSRVSAALDAACEDIRRYCSQTFTFVEEDEITVNGTGRRTLLLPELPVVTVNSVLIDAGEDSEEVVTEFKVDTASGVLWRSSSNGCWPARWPAGFLNITVDYDHGYETVPRDVVNVAVLMARNTITSHTATREAGIVSESIGGYSYTTDSGSSIVTVEESTRKNLQRTLDRYRTPRIPVA